MSHSIKPLSKNGANKGKIRVLVVDDHPLMRDGLQKAFSMEVDIQVVGMCENGTIGLEQATKTRPHVVVLDVNLPDINGLQVAKQLRQQQELLGIVMLTAHHEIDQIVYALRAGANAYCNKDVDPDDLTQIIRDVAQGYYVIENQRMTRREVDNWIKEQIGALSTTVIDPEEHYIPLSPRETEILQAVTDGMSNKEIAMHLGISQQTVKNHMTSILNKLNVNDRTQAAITALKHGWVRTGTTGNS